MHRMIGGPTTNMFADEEIQCQAEEIFRGYHVEKKAKLQSIDGGAPALLTRCKRRRGKSIY